MSWKSHSRFTKATGLKLKSESKALKLCLFLSPHIANRSHVQRACKHRLCSSLLLTTMENRPKRMAGIMAHGPGVMWFCSSSSFFSCFHSVGYFKTCDHFRLGNRAHERHANGKFLSAFFFNTELYLSYLRRLLI